MSRASRSRLLWLEAALVVLGLTCLTWYGWVTAQLHSFQSEQRLELEHLGSAVPAEKSAPLQAPGPATLIGTLDIARLNLSVVVVEGDDDETLKLAVGHLPDTPLPWQQGNSAMAAHRDTLFRPLKDVRLGDEIRLATPHGDLLYRVARTLVVDPHDVSVLEPSAQPTLTLITCFPFFYVGHAPQRFIVQATQVASN